MRAFNFLSLLVSAAAASPVAVAASKERASPNLPNHLVAQFPNNTWLENMAVRPNGNLIVTTLSPNASIYEISEPASKSPHVRRLATIDSITSVFGIAEIHSDVFAVAGGNFSWVDGGSKDTYGVWKLDFTKKKFCVDKVAAIPEAVQLNGATNVPGHPNLFLISDSFLGRVWGVDITTGKYKVVAQYPEMANNGESLSFGINGVHINQGYLWWTNTNLAGIYKVKVNADGTPVRGAKAIAVKKPTLTSVDDFTFGPGDKSEAWFATYSEGKVLALGPNGASGFVARDSEEIPDVTSVKFGRTKHDAKTIYGTTSGSTASGIGGKIQAIDTTRFRLN